MLYGCDIQAAALLGRGLNYPVVFISNQAPYFGDAVDQTVVGHKSLTSDLRKQFVFGDDTARSGDEISQHLCALAPQLYRTSIKPL